MLMILLLQVPFSPGTTHTANIYKSRFLESIPDLPESESQTMEPSNLILTSVVWVIFKHILVWELLLHIIRTDH